MELFAMSIKFCKKCGNENRDGAQRCHSCGSLLVEAEPRPADQSNPFGLPIHRGKQPLIYPRAEPMDEAALETFWAGILKRLVVPLAIACALVAAVTFYILSR
jgi:hypothetical protein